MDSQALAVVGMRRSGTSSVCQALNRLGVSFGSESQLFRGDDFNEEGYWEHKALAGLHRMFRMSLNLRSVDCDPTPENWRERPASKHFLTQGVRCLQEHFLNVPAPWAWKDPDASLALPFVYEVSAQAGFLPQLLICVRNPYDTAQSELRRKSVVEFETVGAWLAHTLGALHGSQSRPRSVIMFSDFLKNPRHALAPTVASLGIQPSDETWDNAVSSVRQGLVHSDAGEEALEAYPPLVQMVYSLCQRAAAGFDEAIEAEIESCYREFESYRRMLWRPALEEATLGALWERGMESRFTQVPYRPSQGWQTVKVETGALPASPVQLFLYPLPANIWIRKAVWHFRDQATDAQLEAGKSANLHHQFGLPYVSLIHGPDHLIIRTPGVKGPFTLELEFLIETNNVIVGETYKILSELCKS